MIDRRNRRSLALIGFLLLVGGGLSAALGGQAFGSARSNRDVFDGTLIRWWNEGGWESFAVVVAIGVVLVAIGGGLLSAQLRRNDGRSRTPDITLSAHGAPGETTLRAPGLSHSIETDLETIPDVSKAVVGLFGRFPTFELRTVLTVSDDIDLDDLPARVDTVLDRLETTTGARPDPVQVTIRFRAAERERQLR